MLASWSLLEMCARCFTIVLYSGADESTASSLTVVASCFLAGDAFPANFAVLGGVRVSVAVLTFRAGPEKHPALLI
jgi:hypothetical protein